VTSTPAELAGVSAVTPAVVKELVHRAAHDGERWLEQVAATGHCSHPIRLSGSVRHIDKQSGEVAVVYATGKEPDGVLLVACGNRREAVCPSCSETYKGDARQLVAAGLVGGKGIPDGVASHPKVFVTFTAPSFGSVHARVAHGKKVGPCHPRRGKCPHGKPLGCFSVHQQDDARIGEAICPECFNYEGQVFWNALAPELWRRTTIAMRRALPRVVGMTAADAARVVRLQYVKVSEFQKRGAVHFHAVLRLDGTPLEDDASVVQPPPAAFTVDVLEQIVREAWAKTKAPCPPVGGKDDAYVRWGEQLDVKRIRGGGPGELTAEAVAAYIAKYSTKSTEGLGGQLHHRVSEATLDHLDAPRHVSKLVRTAWELGGTPALVGLQLRKWAHCLGFRGHFSTKSRRYSTTFGALRRARMEHARRRRFADGVPLDGFGRPEDEDQVVVEASWRFLGAGYRTTGEKWLALSSAAWARERKRTAKEEFHRVLEGRTA
jgi:hypothetical protein